MGPGGFLCEQKLTALLHAPHLPKFGEFHSVFRKGQKPGVVVVKMLKMHGFTSSCRVACGLHGFAYLILNLILIR